MEKCIKTSSKFAKGTYFVVESNIQSNGHVICIKFRCSTPTILVILNPGLADDVQNAGLLVIWSFG